MLTGDDRVEAKSREEEARVWISGSEAVKAKIGVEAIYDLPATPFFLRGSGYPEGTLFPWVASDFSLIDAIEVGIVKVPRVPVRDVDDRRPTKPTATYGCAFARTFPKKDVKPTRWEANRISPSNCKGLCTGSTAIIRTVFRLWKHNAETRARGITPPVFILVCNNSNVSKLVFDYVAGWEKQIGKKTVVQAGQLPIFRNDDGNGRWLHRPVDPASREGGSKINPPSRCHQAGREGAVPPRRPVRP
jgi:type III restriction enzyme